MVYYNNTWPVSKDGQEGYLQAQMSCVLQAGRATQPGQGLIKVNLDRDIDFIENWNLRITSPVETDRPSAYWTLVNPNEVAPGFVWMFQVRWRGTITYGISTVIEPPVPMGTCSFKTGVEKHFFLCSPTQIPTTEEPEPPTDAPTEPPTPVTNTTTQTPVDKTTAPDEGTWPTVDKTPDICKTYPEVRLLQQEIDANSSPVPYNYHEVLCKYILFYEAQRSGDLPANQRVTWRQDSALQDGRWKSINEDLVGGWYDAGDLVKFGLPMASSTTVLIWGYLRFQEAYVMAGQDAYMRDCIRWPLDYFLKLWDDENQRFYAQVGNGDIDHAAFERPEDMTTERPVYYVEPGRAGSDVAGETAAALAAGYMVFNDSDPAYAMQLLSSAEKIYQFAFSHRGKYSDVISDAAKFYSSSGYEDELTVAGVWLYRATGDVSYLNQAKAFPRNDWAWGYEWSSKELAANILLYEETGESSYYNNARNFFHRWSESGDLQYTPGGLVYRLRWGSLRYAANAAFAALVALDDGIVTRAEMAAGTVLDPFKQINYILGDNPNNMSYVVGFGDKYPTRPHHKASFCAPAPAPQCTFAEFHSSQRHHYLLYGAMVGGPDAGGGYDDNRMAYERSEVTCDYNAGLQSAVAGIVQMTMVNKK
ncbi:uncharacterized protein LOC128226088 [Mya arenaria]|uniref:uncharacterized protein LOC128226088 n=1 Tax=Mya arenaria TaxID=6604 RepID=UPI0022E06707|nr:uncharacterized protein LOC128226088 [Mya arenaria]